MKSIIDIKGLAPSNDGMIRQEYTWLDTKYVMLPNVVGMTVRDAQKELKGFKIEYTGIGDTVLYQEPTSGQYVKETGVVKLMLE